MRCVLVLSVLGLAACAGPHPGRPSVSVSGGSPSPTQRWDPSPPGRHRDLSRYPAFPERSPFLLGSDITLGRH